MRRRALSEPLRAPYRAFADSTARLEAAKEDLLRAIPGARAPGVPLAEALLAFREGVEAAASALPAWRVPEVEPEWAACRDGLAAAARAEEAVRLRGGSFAHDALLFTLQDLLAPLEPFEAAARRWAALGRRPAAP